MSWVRVSQRAVALCQNLIAITPGPVASVISSHVMPISRRCAAIRLQRSHLAPALLGVGVWLAFPTAVALQDMASMITGVDSNTSRWNAFVQTSVAGSTQAADMPFADRSVQPGSLSGSGMDVPGIGKVAFRGQGKGRAGPDEARVVRSEKKARIIQIAPVAPPKAFSAGSIFERTSSLMRPTLDLDQKLVFATPAIKGKEVAIAAAFHLKQDEKRRDKGVPSYLADLVNNDKPDILATAYAPVEPDYASSSPFESLLNEEPEMAGRFIPPMGKGDHAWMSQPLPASVFSEKEQQCLANAIYFESRGEAARGQAAVAQVVLNRVRNPTYPKTICDVVYQNDGWFNRCQFSFACDGRKDVIRNRSNYRKAQEIAMAVTAGKIFIPEVGSSTHYYAQYVSPGWARAMNKMTKIGLHIFYRTKNGGWS